ncbi:hypothetical protein SAMN05421854_1326 [Amycolatopsis rubida]|uniref:Uncharacterized protein n=1 Tax=Amycolatopsis rubida TaxID=112413 RepID=A0A1I6BM63_9PSEU|nr:hypothetical protein SAMN05421854_1326 [Amycolatopsis rubida]
MTGPPAGAAPHVRGHREIRRGERPYRPPHPDTAPTMSPPGETAAPLDADGRSLRRSRPGPDWSRATNQLADRTGSRPSGTPFG